MRTCDGTDFVKSMMADADANKARIGTEPKAVYEDLVEAIQSGCETLAILSPSHPGSPFPDETGVHPIISPGLGRSFGPLGSETLIAAYYLNDYDYAARFAAGIKKMLLDHPDLQGSTSQAKKP